MTTASFPIRHLGAVLIALSSLTLSSAALSQARPTINIVSDSLTIFNDCTPANTTSIITQSTPTEGNDFFLATYDDMSIELANKRGKRRGSKDCVMEFDVELPEGYTIGELNLEFDGAMQLPKRARATAEIIVTIAGLTNNPWNNTKRTRVSKVGPFDDDYSQKARFDFGSQSGQLCPKKVRVYVDVLAWAKISRKAAADAEALVTIDRLSGLFSGQSTAAFGVVECKKASYPWWW